MTAAAPIRLRAASPRFGATGASVLFPLATLMCPRWCLQRRSLYNFRCDLMKMPTRCILALLVALALQAVVVAHDIPDEIVVQTYVRPQQNQLQVLVRIPLLAVAEANLPKDGTGYLAMPYIDAALREAANQISNGIVFLEGDERLTRYDMANARISLPSDRSFDTYDGAVTRVRGSKLPDTTKVYYNRS